MSDIELLEKQVQNNPDISEAVLNEINENKLGLSCAKLRSATLR